MKSSPDASSQSDPKRLQHALEYYCALVALSVLSLVPMRFASWVGSRIGDLFRLVLKKRRQVVRDQVRDVLRLEGDALDAFVKRNFRHYGAVLVEFAILGRMESGDFRRYIDLDGLDRFLARARDEDKGYVIITMHFGNWEWANVLTHMAGDTQCGSIARPLDNPRVNELVRRVRERNGNRILDKRGAIRKALGLLRKKGVAAVLNDQDAGWQGMMSPFLGKPASTLTVPIELAIRAGAPIVIVGLVRNGAGAEKRFTAVHSPEIFHARPDAEPEAEVRRLVDATNGELSKIIMKAPEQWFWIHRRWKNVGTR